MPAGYHPILVHLPTALIAGVLVLEIWYLLRRNQAEHSQQTWLLLLAMLGVLSAFFSGYQANDLANAAFIIPDEPISNHHVMGRAVLFALPLTLALQMAAAHAKHGRVGFRVVYLLSLALSTGLVLYAAVLGSQLVYKLGAGVGARPV
ncbi:MAG: hypothetical protein K1X79_13835 [Oligoflexia bacterium]|nr:hypothetical protein [Oligoflexia bacterium]